jgi:hypothetical protein
MNNIYKNKYFKYKSKYLKLKKYIGGNDDFMFRIIYHYKGDLDPSTKEYLINNLIELYQEIEIIDINNENFLQQIYFADYKEFIREKNVGLENYNYLIFKPKLPEQIIKDKMNDHKLTIEEYKVRDKFNQNELIKLIPHPGAGRNGHGLWADKVAMFGIYTK